MASEADGAVEIKAQRSSAEPPFSTLCVGGCNLCNLPAVVVKGRMLVLLFSFLLGSIEQPVAFKRRKNESLVGVASS